MSASADKLDPPTTPNPCWSEIGVYGNGLCAELQKFIHCRNCPVYSRAGVQLLDRPLVAEYRQERTEHFAVPAPRPASKRSSALLFRLGHEWLALPTQAFQEVAEHRPIHSLPHRRDGLVLGLLNVRGELLICISLARFLRLQCQVSSVEGQATVRAHSPSTLETRPSPLDPRHLTLDTRHSALAPRSARLLVANWEGQRLVFPVDEVHGIFQFDARQLKEPPATVAKSNSAFTQAMLLWNERAVGLLDAELLFSALNRSLT